jgi:hypothetical protein
LLDRRQSPVVSAGFVEGASGGEGQEQRGHRERSHVASSVGEGACCTVGASSVSPVMSLTSVTADPRELISRDQIVITPDRG